VNEYDSYPKPAGFPVKVILATKKRHSLSLSFKTWSKSTTSPTCEFT